MTGFDKSYETAFEPAKQAFDFWVSFFPTAPLFGVPWRFEGLANTMTPQMMFPFEHATTTTPADVKEVAPAKTKAEAPVATVEPIAVPEESVEVDAPLASPKCLLAEAPEDVDDLTKIKGVGPGLQTQLHNLGVYKFSQLASFDDDGLAWLDENLMTVKGRCIRDDWVGQAKSFLN
ncbi:MAG: hypothetical protein AAFP68_00740 [Pseudomonadota bacterium]